MKYRIKVKTIAPCGCDAEGQVVAELDNGNIIHFYYQGSDKQAFQAFEIEKIIEVSLIGQLCRAEISNHTTPEFKFPNKNCCFQAYGEVISKVTVNDEELLFLQSPFPLYFENEQGETEVIVGSKVKVSGELWADDWWE